MEKEEKEPNREITEDILKEVIKEYRREKMRENHKKLGLDKIKEISEDSFLE